MDPIEKRVKVTEILVSCLIKMGMRMNNIQIQENEMIQYNFKILEKKIDTLIVLYSKEFGEIKVESEEIKEITGHKYRREIHEFLRISKGWKPMENNPDSPCGE